MADLITCFTQEYESCGSGVECPDGSCANTLSSCPDANGCAAGDVLCFDKTCHRDTAVNPCTDELDNANACPGSRPYRCSSGYCAISATSCPFIYPSVCSDTKPITCADGSCVMTSDQCPLVKPCEHGEFRCDDASCRSTQEACARYNSCPVEAPHRCGSGICAPTQSQCIDEVTGCPADTPLKCSGGDCVTDLATCAEVPEANGCASATPVKCYNGACVNSTNDCLEENGCPRTEPFFCNVDGSCAQLPALCPDTRDPTLEVECADGRWVTTASDCLAVNGCPASQPIRCQDGSCAANSAGTIVSDSETVCPLTVACYEGEFLCSNGLCVAHSSLCEPTLACPNGRCDDLSCVPDNGICDDTSLNCPVNSPVLCETGVCKTSPDLCPDGLSNYGDGSTGGTSVTTDNGGDGSSIIGDDDDCNFICYDGKQFCSPAECLEWVTEINCDVDGCDTSDESALNGGLGSWCGDGQHLCADGKCKEYEECTPIPACGYGYTRCFDGTCVLGDDSSVCGLAESCENDLIRCEDGTCRDQCLRYNGCGLDKPYHCFNRNCAVSQDECELASVGVGSNDHFQRSPLTVSASELVETGDCVEDCMSDIKASWATYSIDRNINYEFSIASDDNFLTVGELTVPSGSILSGAAQAADGRSLIRVRGIPDSRVRNAENKVKPSRSDEHGEFKTYPQTVLSPMFECVAPENVTQPFPIKLVYTATIDSFPVFNGGELEIGGYNYEDVCFAKLVEISQYVSVDFYFTYKAWRCVIDDSERVANPVRAADSTEPAGLVSFGFDSCAPGANQTVAEGAVYAFIFAPLERVEDDNSFLTWLAENASLVMIICILATFAFFGGMYGASRLSRYRAKLKKARKDVDTLQEDVLLMEEKGGEAGTKDIEVVMVSNPMVTHLKDLQIQDDQEDLVVKEKEVEMRVLQSVDRKKKMNILRAERDRTAKDLEQLQAQLLQAQDKPTSTRHRTGQSSDMFTFDDDQDDSDDNKNHFGRGGFDDSDEGF